MSAVTAKAVNWTELGYVPDTVIRAGIRRLLESKRREIRPLRIKEKALIWLVQHEVRVRRRCCWIHLLHAWLWLSWDYILKKVKYISIGDSLGNIALLQRAALISSHMVPRTISEFEHEHQTCF